MIQRILRGRLLYLLAGALIVFIYVKAGPIGSPTPYEAAKAVPADETLAWWPTGLDPAAFKDAVVREPFLGVTLSVLTMVMVGMGLGGMALSGWALWTGQIRGVFRASSRGVPPWSFGELGRIIALALMVASLLPLLSVAWHVQHPGGGDDRRLGMAVSMLFLDVFVILLILAFAIGKGPSVGMALGWSRSRLWPSITTGLRGYLAVFPWIFILLFIIVEVARSLGLKPPVEPIQELIFQEHRPAVLGLIVVLACVVGPVAEELFFRGVLYAALRQRTSRLAAVVISGAAFSLIHTNPVGFLPITVLGCLLADLYERTGSLASPLAVHLLHNTLLMSLALVFRRLLVVAG